MALTRLSGGTSMVSQCPYWALYAGLLISRSWRQSWT